MSSSPAPNSEPFEDPLQNYEPQEFDDPIAAALAEATVASLRIHPHLCVSVSTSVRDTMKLMVGRQIACVLVEDQGKLAGIFSDRDVLDKVAFEYDQVIDGPVSAVMTPEPVVVHLHDSAARVICIMAVSGYRHVPVVDENGGIEGIVSPQRVAQFLFQRLSAASSSSS